MQNIIIAIRRAAQGGKKTFRKRQLRAVSEERILGDSGITVIGGCILSTKRHRRGKNKKEKGYSQHKSRLAYYLNLVWLIRHQRKPSVIRHSLGVLSGRRAVQQSGHPPLSGSIRSTY